MRFMWATATFTLYVSTLVNSQPTTTNSTLLASAQAAQALNAQFKTLTTTSPCGNLTRGCVNNAIATCDNDVWEMTRGQCAKGQSCFALPNIRTAETILSCTSEKNALSVLESTGAQGGITGPTNEDSSNAEGDDNGSDSNEGDNSKDDPDASSTGTVSASTPATTTDDGGDRVTVTVTVTKPIVTSNTRTISPEEASSIISILMGPNPVPTTSVESDAESTPCPDMTSATSTPTSDAVEATSTPLNASPTATMASGAKETGTGPSTSDDTATSSDSSDGSDYGY